MKKEGWKCVPGKQQAQADSLCAGLKIVKTLTKFLESVEKENQPDDSQQILQESKESEARFSKSEQKTDTGPSCQIKTEREPKVQLVNPFWAGANRPDHPLLPIPRPPKSVEIIGGDIIGICECLKRNGLQHDCPKRDCRGKDLCMVWPSPRCQPSGLGAPIVHESRIKKPEVAQCELTPSELKMNELLAAKEKRKEEARLVERAREDWQLGVDRTKADKELLEKYGYRKCNWHRNKYRLLPLMRNRATQTVDSPREESS
ncbi:spermatid development [Nesidiocoris tenuis]|uniref:Spermatid development n=1 Tax=Nesidiocoris tenuis TaxID=355587 RepID=A0ABN7AAT5_9HEMI|nr:spermatid development [Nesidiocoris tenuis]